jgi:hypothetical protein
MQIFLPFPDFEKSCASLDTIRLGKQRVEAFQIWKALTSKTKWSNHVCTRMWKDNIVALRSFIVICCRIYSQRKTKSGKFCQNTKMDQHIQENDLVVKPNELIVLPKWFGDDKFHDSHKAMLYYKGVENTKNGLFPTNPYEQFEKYSHITEYYYPIPLITGTSKISSTNTTTKQILKPSKTIKKIKKSTTIVV